MRKVTCDRCGTDVNVEYSMSYRDEDNSLLKTDLCREHYNELKQKVRALYRDFLEVSSDTSEEL